MARARVIRLRIAAIAIAPLIIVIPVAIVILLNRFFFEVDIKELGHGVQGFGCKFLANFLETFPPLPRHGIEEESLDRGIVKLSVISSIRDGRDEVIHNENLALEVIWTGLLGLG